MPVSVIYPFLASYALDEPTKERMSQGHARWVLRSVSSGDVSLNRTKDSVH